MTDDAKREGISMRFVEPMKLVSTSSFGFCVNKDGTGWVERDGNRQEISQEDAEALGRFVFGDRMYDLVKSIKSDE